MICWRLAVYSASEIVPVARNVSSSCRRWAVEGSGVWRTGGAAAGAGRCRGGPARGAHHLHHLLTHNRIRPDVDGAVHRDVVRLEDLHDLHQRTGLPGQVVGPVVLGERELCRHHSADQSASLPIDLVPVRGRVDQDDQLAAGDQGQPGHRGDHPVLDRRTASGRGPDVQVDLDQRLIVDPGAGFGDPGDLRQRQHSLVLEESAFLAADLAPLVRQEQRDQDVGGGDQQARPEHPFENRDPWPSAKKIARKIGPTRPPQSRTKPCTLR